MAVNRKKRPSFECDAPCRFALELREKVTGARIGFRPDNHSLRLPPSSLTTPSESSRPCSPYRRKIPRNSISVGGSRAAHVRTFFGNLTYETSRGGRPTDGWPDRRNP